MAHRPTRSRQSRRAARLDFAGLEIVGALLTPDIVARLAAFEANDQTVEGYEIPPGLKLRDEIARYYRIGEALWSRFETSRGQSAAASERFVLDLLRQCFGFASLGPQSITRIGEREFPVRHAALGGCVPIVIAPAPAEGARRSGVDESLAQFGDSSRRRSATLLLQEYLNAREDAAWGLVSDGVTLRVMRDNISLTRPAWIEANLSKIFSEGLFPDFSALWLLIHQSRFGQADAPISDCALERWRERGRTDGVAARDKLRQGVEAALLELGQGFIENPANGALRQALTDGALSGHAYFEQLLRVIYRLIFIFAAEDRGLLHPAGTSDQARRAYAEGYSLARLRERSMRRTAWDRHADSWEGLKATFQALMRGQEQLGLPALGGLFAHGVVPDVENARIENRRLLAAIWRLAWLRPEGQPLTRVNWRDMETEELGSVYESLLELEPRASADTRTFEFAVGDEARGNARKTTGSFYTPDALVKLLLDSTLEPILDAAEARNIEDPANEILKLSIIDPACGSGHFLLGAARRAAARIAKHRSPGAPSQDEFQHALREVVSHCIYGVDRNPMAVELCKVALWIEALEPGKPLTFLDSHIRCGDSLIGVFDYEMLRRGIPDAAYKQLSGDAKEAAKIYSKFNKQHRDGKGATGFLSSLRPPVDLIDAARAIADMPENTLGEIGIKRSAFERLHSGHNWLNIKTASDCYIAAFFAPKTGDAPGPKELARPSIPLTDHVWAVLRGQTIYGPLVGVTDRIAQEVRAFHWPIEFPHIFARGGFDVVIGNPPWEVSQLGEQEYFAAKSPEIASMRGDERKRAIARLELDNPWLWGEFVLEKRRYEAANEFFRASGRFDLTAVGKINSYALFAEHFERLTSSEGRAGVMVPTGIATDSTTSAFFGDLIERSRLTHLYSFYEIRGWFKGTDDRKSFCIFGIGSTRGAAEFCFDIGQIVEMDNPERRFTLSANQIARINPNTHTAPVFRSRADAELTAQLYSRVPVLFEERIDEDGGDVNPWGVSFQQGLFNMTSASEYFRTAEQLALENWTCDGSDWVREVDSRIERRVPLYEAKMVHHFDHRWATYAGASIEDEEGARDCTLTEKQDSGFESAPRYWVPETEVILRAARVPSSLKRGWREANHARILKSLVEWLIGYYRDIEGRAAHEEDIHRVLGENYAWRSILDGPLERFLREPKTLVNAAEMQRETPLSSSDIAFLVGAPQEPRELAAALIGHKQPRWLMGWRDIALRSVERTVIASVFPKVGVNHKIPLLFIAADAKYSAALLGMMTSLTFDYVARQKIGGSSLTYSYIKQFPTLPPTAFSDADLAFIKPCVLELTYTSNSMRLWAEDLGYSGPPFPWDELRRADLRAELDAFFGRKFGLDRDQLRYVLDPTDSRGADYPSETFRVLKAKEEARFGEYRTGRLILEAWDRHAANRLGERPTEVRAESAAPRVLRDNAWARPMPAGAGDAGAMLAAILKAMTGPMPARQVRLAATFGLEPRLLLPHLDPNQAAEWQRLVGAEAAPLTGNAASFAPRADRTWGNAVTAHRGNGRLVEDLTTGTWAPGPGLNAIDTAGWPDGRAGMLMRVLPHIATDAVISAMPAEIRGWIDAAAA